VERPELIWLQARPKKETKRKPITGKIGNRFRGRVAVLPTAIVKPIVGLIGAIQYGHTSRETNFVCHLGILRLTFPIVL